MTEREKIIALARECGLNTLVIELFVNNFYHAAQRKAFEQAANVARPSTGVHYDPYNVTIRNAIAKEIRQLIKE